VERIKGGAARTGFGPDFPAAYTLLALNVASAPRHVTDRVRPVLRQMSHVASLLGTTRQMGYYLRV